MIQLLHLSVYKKQIEHSNPLQITEETVNILQTDK